MFTYHVKTREEKRKMHNTRKTVPNVSDSYDVYDKKRCLMCLMCLTLVMSMAIVPVSVSGQVTIPDRDKTFMIGTRQKVTEPHNMNPYVGDTYKYNMGYGIGGIYESLFYLNIYQGVIIPWLGASYELSDDYKTLTVNLRQGVKWSDGELFTADDIVFTYDMLRENKDKIGAGRTIDTYLEAVNKVDDYTVEFVSRQPDPRLISNPAVPTVIMGHPIYLLPQHIWEGEDPIAFKNWPPIGTGPYAYIEQTETESLLKRRDDYWGWDVWGVRPAPEYLNVKYSNTPDVHMMLFARDELDQGGKVAGLTPESIGVIQQDNPFVTGFDPDFPTMNDVCTRTIDVNLDKYPWSLKEVRRALQYIYNMEKIIRAEYGGPYAYPATSLICDAHDLMRSDYKEVFYSEVDPVFDISEYNPEKAEAILTNLGFARGSDGVWVTPNGTRLEAEFILPSGYAYGQYAFAEDATEFGIPITIKYQEVGQWWVTRDTGAWEDFMWGLYCTSTIDPFDAFRTFHSSNALPKGQSGGNPTRWKNSAFDAIIDEWASTHPDDPRAKELFVDAANILFDDMPVIVAYETRDIAIMNTKHWLNYPSASNPYAPVQWWWATYQFVLMGYQHPETGEWVSGVRPREVERATVYMTGDVREFRTVDGAWIGPLEKGDSARIPIDDAELLINKGLASYTPEIEIPGLESIESALTSMSDQLSEATSNVSDLKTSNEQLASTVNNLMILVGVSIVVGIVAIVLILTKK